MTVNIPARKFYSVMPFASSSSFTFYRKMCYHLLNHNPHRAFIKTAASVERRRLMIRIDGDRRWMEKERLM